GRGQGAEAQPVVQRIGVLDAADLDQLEAGLADQCREAPTAEELQMLDVDDRRSPAQQAVDGGTIVMRDEAHEAPRAQETPAGVRERTGRGHMLHCLETADEIERLRFEVAFDEHAFAQTRADVRLRGGDRRPRGLDADDVAKADAAQARKEYARPGAGLQRAIARVEAGKRASQLRDV